LTPAVQAPDVRTPAITTPPLSGPDFSSYRADEVTWLLKDLSAAPLERPVEEREEAIQAGRAHYAESLPIEYQPSAEYIELFHQALAASARRVAYAVGMVTSLVLDSRRDPVLVSLARAGTPVGILMRRWAAFAGGPDLPHYTISIVRGRGIDEVALAYLAARYAPGRLTFVDGWTGKGAIARELAAALAGTPFDPTLTVLADPGRCVPVYGTRDDFLIPSACLNSTVSGLVSRTVLNDRLIGPDEFHGAKFYRELSSVDLSRTFLDAVSACFPAVAAEVAADWPALAAADRTPDWAGWRAVERIAADHGIDNLHLVKPGVGETTRVLLRRVPWRVLVRPGLGGPGLPGSDNPASRSDIAHVLLLASQRGVPVEEVADLPYACVGLIKPGYP